jgi:hypothetical protein
MASGKAPRMRGRALVGRPASLRRSTPRGMGEHGVTGSTVVVSGGSVCCCAAL